MPKKKNDILCDLKRNVQNLSVVETGSDFELFHILSKHYIELQTNATEEILETLANLDWQFCVDEKIIAIASEWFSVVANINPKLRLKKRVYDVIVPSNFSKVAALSYAFLMDFYQNRRKNLAPRLHFWLGQSDYKGSLLAFDEPEFSYVEYTLQYLGVESEKAANYRTYAQTISIMDEKNGRDIKYILPLYKECNGEPAAIENAIDISNIL